MRHAAGVRLAKIYAGRVCYGKRPAWKTGDPLLLTGSGPSAKCASGRTRQALPTGRNSHMQSANEAHASLFWLLAYAALAIGLLAFAIIHHINGT